MKMRTILTVCLALVFGLSAVYGVMTWMAQARGGGAPVDTVGVVIITKDVPRYTPLSAEVLKVTQFPKKLAPPGSAAKVEELAGRVLDVALVKDEAVLESKLVPKGAGRGMASGIPKGMRALTIQTANIASAVAGLVLPGNKVDVLYTLRGNQSDERTGGASTRTLLEQVEILAVNQRLDPPADNKAVVANAESSWEPAKSFLRG
jgi:pilus assembly protein CpaB